VSDPEDKDWGPSPYARENYGVPPAQRTPAAKPKKKRAPGDEDDAATRSLPSRLADAYGKTGRSA
jgi:hypothetical protein